MDLIGLIMCDIIEIPIIIKNINLCYKHRNSTANSKLVFDLSYSEFSNIFFIRLHLQSHNILQ